MTTRRTHPLAQVSLPTDGAEVELVDDQFVPTPAERERQAKAEEDRQRRSVPEKLNNDDEDDGA